MGFAKYVGVFSPAIITRILGSDSAPSMSSIPRDVGFPSSPPELVEVLRKEQTRSSNATATSPNMSAMPPKRYGIGDLQLLKTASPEEAAELVEFAIKDLIAKITVVVHTSPCKAS